MAQRETDVTKNISQAEWALRCELAACYRLFLKFGWTDLIFTHLSARVPDAEDQYLINPFGLLFSEITASNLIKVDFDGQVITGDYPYNDAGHAIHSSILKARSDINIVLHSHTRAGMAVACMQEGLMPLTQQAGEVMALLCYHDYGFADDSNTEECQRLAEDISDKYLMIMRNHGLLSVGRSVAEAFYYLYTLENACKVQVDVMASGATPVLLPGEPMKQLAGFSRPPVAGPHDLCTRSWAALIRMLDDENSDYAS